jgi:hypothetical protein
MKPFMAIIGTLSLFILGCRHETSFTAATYEPDQSVVGQSKYPVAVDPAKVGSYDALAQSGGGYFYDDVLEYRVWLCPARGAKDLDEGNDYFFSFAQYERAVEFSRTHNGSEKPLALVRQREWIDEPEPGKYFSKKGERLTEWQAEWLDAKRAEGSVQEFLKHPKPMRIAEGISESEDRDAANGNLRKGHQ